MDQFSAHLDRGWDLIHRGDFAGAQVSAERSLELDAESPEAYNLLGYARAAQGDHDTALQHYRYALALDDTFVEAMLNAAEVLIHPLHDFAAAMDMVNEALDYADGDDEIADALLVKFDALLHQGDREGAARVLNDLPEGPFEGPRLDFLVGRACYDVGQLERARKLLARAQERDPSNADASHVLGLVHDALGQTREATMAFLRTRELDLRSAPAPWSRGAAHVESELRAALALLEPDLGAVLHDALVVITDMPGAEAIADGVDPRASLLLDAPSRRGEPPRVGRVFVYQRNLERSAESADRLADELLHLLRLELSATFPELAPAPSEPPPAAEDETSP